MYYRPRVLHIGGYWCPGVDGIIRERDGDAQTAYSDSSEDVDARDAALTLSTATDGLRAAIGALHMRLLTH